MKDRWYIMQDTFTLRQLSGSFCIFTMFFFILAPTVLLLPPAILLLEYDDQPQIGRNRLALKWGNIIAIHLAHHSIPDKEMTALLI